MSREIFWGSINTRYRLSSSVLRCLGIILILTLAKTHRCDGTHIQLQFNVLIYLVWVLVILFVYFLVAT